MSVTDQAFVTLGTNDVYCHGALVLGQSLRNHKTSRRLVVLITHRVSRAMRSALSSVFDEVMDVNEIDSGDSVHLALLKRLELGVTFTKLHCWTLTQYSKCVFMDADTLVLCNIDELFDREEFSAAPDSGWPDCFNSGVFVFRPSLKTFNLLLQFASEHGSFDGGDQGLLNSFFSDWATTDIGKHLPFIYNLSSSAVYTYAPAFQYFGKDAKVVHFLGPAKPWNYKYNPQTRTVTEDGSASIPESQLSFLELWWVTYSSNILPLLEKVQEKVSDSEPFKSEIQNEEPNPEHNPNHVYSKPNLNEDEMEFQKENTVSSNSLPISVNIENVPETVVNSIYDSSTTSNDECSLEIKAGEPSESPSVDSVPQYSKEMDEVTSSVSELTIESKPEELSAEEERRKWEEGYIDYMGKDAFENIQKKLDSFLF